MRALIGKILAGLTAMVVVPVTMIINGVKQVVHMLLPGKNQQTYDEAQAEIEADRTSDAMAAWEAAHAGRVHQPMTEGEKIRSAAEDVRHSRPVPACLFDPGKPAQAQVAKWLASLTAAEALALTKADDEAIALHLDGKRKIQHVRMLPEVQALLDEATAANEPLSVLEWTRELMRRAAESGADPDGDMIDDLIEKANELADRGARLEDYPAEQTAPTPDRVIDDREDA